MKFNTLSSKKKFSVLAVLSAALLLGVIAFYSFSRNNQPGSQDSPLVQTRNQTAALAGGRQYDEAIAAWERFLATNPSPAEQSEAYQQIATINQNKQDPVAALAAYRRAEEVSGQTSLNATLNIAGLSETAGDIATAREYYQKAIGLLDPVSPLYESDKADIEEKVRSLQ